MSFKCKKGKPALLTKKEKIEVIEDGHKFSEIFDHSHNLLISFFPNGSDKIWLKDATDPNIGIELGFGLGDRGLVVQVRNLNNTNPIYFEQLTKDIQEFIQLKNNKQ